MFLKGSFWFIKLDTFYWLRKAEICEDNLTENRQTFPDMITRIKGYFYLYLFICSYCIPDRIVNNVILSTKPVN